MLFVCYEKCGTCRKAEAWLKEKQLPYDKRPIKEEQPTLNELKEWHKRSGLPVRKLFNTSGQLYKSMNLREKLPGMSDEEQLQLLSTDGMLVKRPILVSENAVFFGFKEEDWQSALI